MKNQNVCQSHFLIRHNGLFIVFLGFILFLWITTASAQTEKQALFDDMLVIGTVFNDKNENGVQDSGEQGIPGVRIINSNGMVIITDQNGEYHLKGVYGGDNVRGFNYLLKVDPNSLPTAHRFVTPNPKLRRVTPGSIVRFDFAIKLQDGKSPAMKPVVFLKANKDNIY